MGCHAVASTLIPMLLLNLILPTGNFFMTLVVNLTGGYVGFKLCDKTFELYGDLMELNEKYKKFL